VALQLEGVDDGLKGGLAYSAEQRQILQLGKGHDDLPAEAREADLAFVGIEQADAVD
jgi:hypothetical protein